MSDPNLYLLPIALSILFHSVLGQNGAVSIPGAERSALLGLRSSLGLRGKDWPVKSDHCSWTGVDCAGSVRVAGINLSGLRRTTAGKVRPGFAVDSIQNLTGLVYFNASGFSLPGSIPVWFGQRLSRLEVLDLSSSSVSGSIPATLGGLKKINFISLAGNKLTGTVPFGLGVLVELSVLDLSGNLLTGSVPADFASLINLTKLDLSGNFLSGSVNPGFGSLSKLQSLNLSGNNLTGSVPFGLGVLVELSVLDLSGNFLTGSVPNDFASLVNLTKLDLSGNFLSGSVDPGFGSLSKLQSLNLSGNSLSGSVPGELGKLDQLLELDLGMNSLSGPFPEELGLLRGLKKMVIGHNKLDGSLPDFMVSMPNLSLVDVSCNNFTGVLPNLDSYSNAGVGLNLSNNQFFGSLTSLGRFLFVDLSGNYFQGKVGQSNATKLERNCLQVVLNQRDLEDCRLFYEQRGLNFDNFGAQEPEQEHRSSKKRKRLVFVMVGLFGGLGFMFLLVLFTVLVLRICFKSTTNQRSIANVGSSVSTISGLGESFTYEQMILATGGFSESNLIKHGHSGDLYRGTLGGTPVIIKKVDSDTNELEFFGKVSNTRLVPLLGHCLEKESEKVLVYKYMPNGDLASSFYRVVSNQEDDILRSLDWITRLKIAIGTAEGLSYLHHECIPPIVHRDVQASSVLLDDKYEVRLGSFSEVHAQQDGRPNVLTRLLSKPQTSDIGPSGPSSVTCPYDVYCFGKLLLELVTGKIGISKSDDSTTRQWLDQTLPYISMYDKELITKIIDPSLIVHEDLLEEVWAMAIVARSCLNPKPSRRPLMRYVVTALENPLKVVRDDSSHSGRLRTTTSSRRSWGAATFLGSWRQHGRTGSRGSGGMERLSSNKRLSGDIFPEPGELQDVERQAEH